ADYGGENIGYSTPANPSSVHRVSLATGSWEVRAVYIAGNIQATADDHFVVKSSDQWISFNYYSWGVGPSADVLNGSGPFNGYYALVYFGDFRYDYRSARLIHGSEGSSSQEIQAFLVQSTGFTKQEGSGTYGSAQGFGGTVALANDGSAFYYGELAVDALDVTHNLHQFPE
ncbi:MAG TPA: hypothetical protein VHW01_30075, partial [Polyangiaceae bacterium]|nr:hypothetical protein [Polyangiaceae bacterium]